MILHTSLTERQARNALYRAQAAGLVTPDVGFAVFRARGSRTHARAIEVQLGTPDKWSLPEGTTDRHGKRMRVRRYKNSGTRGATSEWNTGMPLYAATWHEWGWLMAFTFTADPQARFGGLTGWGYRDARDFHYKTGNEFTRLPEVPDRCRCLDSLAQECASNGRSCAPLMRVPEQMVPSAVPLDLEQLTRERQARAHIRQERAALLWQREQRDREQRARRAQALIPAGPVPDLTAGQQELLRSLQGVQRSTVVKKQLAANEELLDDPVFGPPVAPGTKFGW